MSNVVLCFETKRRGVVKPPYGVNVGSNYYLLLRVSPNAPNCGIYKKVTFKEYFARRQGR